MSFQHSESETRVPRSRMNFQDRFSSSIMDVRARKMTTNNPPAPTPDTRVEKMEYNRSLSQGSSRRLLSASHFSLVSLLLLICLTASLLILPLVLPPLPPPPFMLLLLPIGILALLMFLAFMPSNARDITYTCNHILRAQKELFISKADASSSVMKSSSCGLPSVVYTSSSAMSVVE
uniref:ARGOS-like protein n=1 Tax=Salix viminalis TaxID=40686 RepID=A0A6N2N1X5_SALVM